MCCPRLTDTGEKRKIKKKKFKHSTTSHCVRTHRVVIQARPPPHFHVFDFRFKHRQTKWLPCKWPCVQPNRILFSLYFWQPCDSLTVYQRIMLISSKSNYRGRNGRDEEYIPINTFCWYLKSYKRIRSYPVCGVFKNAIFLFRSLTCQRQSRCTLRQHNFVSLFNSNLILSCALLFKTLYVCWI